MANLPGTTTRRSALAWMASLGIPASAWSQQSADSYPDRLVRFINPWAPGGPADLICRAVVERLGPVWKQPVIMENKPGANGVVGTQFVVKAPPDGYTILLSQSGPNVIQPSLGKGTPYDPINDFTPITQLQSSPLVVIVRPDLPIYNMADLVAYGRANPGKLSYASAGNGSILHLAGEMVKSLGGFDMVQVPYKGAAPILTDMFGGLIALSFLNPSVVAPHIAAGKVRAIGVTTLKRSGVSPTIPAVSETLPGFDIKSWYGLMAPAKTPPAIVNKIYQAVAEIVRRPEVTTLYQSAGLDVELSTPAQYSQTLREEIAHYAKLIKEFKITSEE